MFPNNLVLRWSCSFLAIRLYTWLHGYSRWSGGLRCSVGWAPWLRGSKSSLVRQFHFLLCLTNGPDSVLGLGREEIMMHKWKFLVVVFLWIIITCSYFNAVRLPRRFSFLIFFTTSLRNTYCRLWCLTISTWSSEEWGIKQVLSVLFLYCFRYSRNTMPTLFP